NAAAPIDVVSTAPADAQAVSAYARQISLLPDVARVVSSAGAFSHGTGDPSGADPGLGRPDGQRVTVLTDLPTKSDGSQDLVRTMRALPGPGGAAVVVGGADAQLIDTSHVIAQRLPIALGVVVLTTLVVLFLFTGSVIQPIRAVLLNALSLSATLGG